MAWLSINVLRRSSWSRSQDQGSIDWRKSAAVFIQLLVLSLLWYKVLTVLWDVGYNSDVIAQRSVTESLRCKDRWERGRGWGEGKGERWGNLMVQGGRGGYLSSYTWGWVLYMLFTVYNFQQFLPTYVWSWCICHWSLCHSLLNWGCAVVATWNTSVNGAVWIYSLTVCRILCQSVTLSLLSHQLNWAV